MRVIAPRYSCSAVLATSFCIMEHLVLDSAKMLARASDLLSRRRRRRLPRTLKGGGAKRARKTHDSTTWPPAISRRQRMRPHGRSLLLSRRHLPGAIEAAWPRRAGRFDRTLRGDPFRGPMLKRPLPKPWYCIHLDQFVPVCSTLSWIISRGGREGLRDLRGILSRLLPSAILRCTEYRTKLNVLTFLVRKVSWSRKEHASEAGYRFPPRPSAPGPLPLMERKWICYSRSS